jgi:hypothetical protein
VTAQKNGEKRRTNGTFAEGNTGRPLGAVNKTTGILKEAILIAAADAGDIWAEHRIAEALREGEVLEGRDANGGLVGYLTVMATRHPQSFLPLLGKVLPLVLSSPEYDQHRAAIQARAEKFTQQMLALMDRVDQGRAN